MGEGETLLLKCYGILTKAMRGDSRNLLYGLKRKKKKQAPFPLAFYFLLIIQYSFQFGA